MQIQGIIPRISMEHYLYQDLYDFEEKHWWHIAKRRLMLAFIKSVSGNKKLKILDVGCGTGKNVETLNPFGEAYGIDKSRQAVAFCKKRKLKRILVGTAESTGFPPSEFDVVTLLDVLEHVDEAKALTELGRILKPAGYIVINVPAFDWLWSEWDEVLHHKRRYTSSSLHSTLESMGFRVKKISYVFSFLVLPLFIVRKLKSLFSKNKYGSDFRVGSPLTNFVFLKLSDLERWFIMQKSVPMGTSIMCLAEKVS